jgi:hypothetical protein
MKYLLPSGGGVRYASIGIAIYSYSSEHLDQREGLLMAWARFFPVLALLLLALGCPAQPGGPVDAPEDSTEAIAAPQDVFAAEASPALEVRLADIVASDGDEALRYASLRRLEEMGRGASPKRGRQYPTSFMPWLACKP